MRFFRLWLLALALSIAGYGQATGVMLTVEGDGHGTLNVVTIFPRLLAMGNCSGFKPSAKLLPEWKPVFRNFTEGSLCRSVIRMQFTGLSMLRDEVKAVSFPPALSMSLTQSGNEFTIDVQKGAKTGAGKHPILPLDVMAMQIAVQVSVPEIVEVKGGGSFTPRPNPRTVQMEFPMEGAYDVAVVARLANVPPLPPPQSSGGKGGPAHATLPDWVMPLLVTLALGVLAALAYFLWPVIAEMLGFGAAEEVEEAAIAETQALKVPQGLTEDQFTQISKEIRDGASQYGDDIAVHGSRASGTARLDSDIDFAIRVSPEKFDEIINERFGTPNPGSAKERTMLNAIETGKIQSGEVKLSALRVSLEQTLGMKVDLSVVKIGGPFDNGPWIPLK